LILRSNPRHGKPPGAGGRKPASGKSLTFTWETPTFILETLY
jgi:hypothetical protein